MRVRVLPTRLFHRHNAIHEADAWVIVALVALHLAAIAFHAIAKRQGLVGAMLTGDKRLEAGREGEASRG